MKGKNRKRGEKQSVAQTPTPVKRSPLNVFSMKAKRRPPRRSINTKSIHRFADRMGL